MSEPLKPGQCEECKHVFSRDEMSGVNVENPHPTWGHPCFDTSIKGNKRNPGSKMLCESYRQPIPASREEA